MPPLLVVVLREAVPCDDFVVKREVFRLRVLVGVSGCAPVKSCRARFVHQVSFRLKAMATGATFNAKVHDGQNFCRVIGILMR